MARILLVEDDENLRETVHDWLMFEKHAVETAADGREAVEQLSVNDFDLVVLDWHLPHMNGIDVLKNYRAAGGRTPVMLLTGLSSPEEKRMGMEAGAQAFLKKPFQLKELSSNIQKLLTKGV